MNNGCRPITDEEYKQALLLLQTQRDKTLLILGCKSGFRISELLSITTEDVYKNNQVVNNITVHRKNMKGKAASRTIPLHPEAKLAIQLLIQEDPSKTYLFESRKNSQNGNSKAITRIQAYRILTKVYKALGMTGKLGTHSSRKHFAHKVHEKLGRDILKTQKALGHKQITSTVSYLSVDQGEVNAAILEI